MTQVQEHGNEAQPSNATNVLANGVKLIGESVLPGASLLLDGKFVNGALHTVAGLGARFALGPVGVVLVCADSYSKSVTDKTLWDHASEAYKANAEKRAAAKKAKAESKAAQHEHAGHAEPAAA